MAFGLPFVNSPNEVCETCVLGNKYKYPFPVGKLWRARKPLELIHSNLCLMKAPSKKDHIYLIIFIDDFS